MAYRYANLEKIKLFVDYRKLVQLTNDNDAVDDGNSANINEDILMEMENDAASTVDNYLRNVYTVPLVGEDITPDIRRMVSQLSHINLMKRRGFVPEEFVIQEERIRANLKKMASSDAEMNRGGRLATSLPASTQRTGHTKRRGIERSGLTDVLDAMGERHEDD